MTCFNQESLLGLEVLRDKGKHFSWQLIFTVNDSHHADSVIYFSACFVRFRWEVLLCFISAMLRRSLLLYVLHLPHI